MRKKEDSLATKIITKYFEWRLFIDFIYLAFMNVLIYTIFSLYNNKDI